MLWQIKLFDIEFKNGEHAQFVGTFGYAQEVLPFNAYDKLGIHMVWPHVMTWNSAGEGFMQDRLDYAKKYIYTSRWTH